MDIPQNKSNQKTGEIEAGIEVQLQEQIVIETLDLNKKLEIVKKINYQDQYEQGRYIDAMDTVNQWCLAEIIGIDQRTLNIHFDGWSQKWDLYYKMNSMKVAPFRKWSRGYTGQVKIALRKLQFNMEDLLQEKQKVEKLIESDLNGLGAFETTQYFRGRLYIYVDFLMGLSNLTDEQVDAVIDFLNAVLKLVVTWLRKLPSLIYLFAQVKVNSDLYMIDENIAILMSNYELFDILKKIFCCCHRSIKFYVMYDKNAIIYDKMVTLDPSNINFEKKRCKEEEEFDVEEMKSKISNRNNIIYGQFINFVNIFANLGGFEALVTALKIGNEQEEKIPLELISILTNPFRNCNSVFAKPFAEKFITTIKESVFDRINNMNEKEIKEIDKELVSSVLQEMKDFLNLHYTDAETSELVESNQLSIAHRFLKSSYLEKRLKGLNHIKHMIDRIEAQQRFQQQINDRRFRNDINQDQEMNGVGNQIIGGNNSIGKFKQPLKWLTAEYLRDWIINQRVLDTLLGENTHLEIVKRSGCILKFLSKLGALPQDAIELIWKCQLGKHEEMVRVIYNIIRELVPTLNQDQIDQIYIKIASVQPKSYDEKFLQFLKDFTLKALLNFYEVKSNETSMNESQAFDYSSLLDQREILVLQKFNEHLNHPNKGLTGEEKLYGLPIFWELIQDKQINNVTNEMVELAIASITEILTQNSCKQIRLSYVIKCVENLMKGESIVPSLILIQAIINQYPEYKYEGQNNLIITQQEFIYYLEKEVNIMELMIQNINKYYQIVKEKMKHIDKSKSNEDFSNHIFSGRHSHSIKITKTLEFLEFLIIQSNLKVSLGEKNIETLWNIFVQQPNFNQDQTMFLKWINKQREVQYKNGQEYYIFTDEEKKIFFVKILCNPTYINFKQMSVSLVKCFQKYFKDINKQEHYLIMGRKALRVMNFKDLIGLDTLWKICIECQNEKVKEESIDLLVDLHLKFDFQSIPYEQQRLIWEDFINQCMQKIEERENDLQIQNAIQLISKFLDRYDGKKSLKPDMKVAPHFQNIQPLNLMVMNRSDQTRKQVTITYFQTLGALRQKIGEAFEYQLSEFTMFIKNQYIDPDEDDDKYVKDIANNFQQLVIQRNQAYIPEHHPKNIIANNQQYFDKLFSLLNSDQNKFIQPVWDLLMKLPINVRLQSELHSLASVSKDLKYWTQLLDPKSTFKLLYSLRIVNSLISNKKDPKTIQWRNSFLALNGQFHLLHTFIELDIKKIENPLTMKCIELLIQLINEFISQDREILKELLSKKELFFNKCINLLDLICDYSIHVEQQRGEAYEVINKRNILNKMIKNKYKSYQQGNKQSNDKKQGNQSNQVQPQQNDDDDDNENTEAQQLQQFGKEFFEQNKLVSLIFQFLIQCILNYDNSAIVLLAQYQQIQDLLYKGLIKIENFLMRNELSKRMVQLISQRTGQSEMKSLLKIVEIILFSFQKKVEEHELRCQQFFDCASNLVDSIIQIDLKALEPQIQKLMVTLSNDILQREIKEKNLQNSDTVLGGKMRLLKALLQKFPQYKEPIGKMTLQYLLHQCLFEISSGDQVKNKQQLGFPKCKTNQSRSFCVKLIAVLCRDCIPNLHVVLEYLKVFNENPSWRTNKDHDWSIQPRVSEKSSTGYVGIKNLGCICYMNSLFQQLFMIPSFRNDILNVKNNNQEEKEENMLYQLQLLWTGLLKSEKMYVTPKGLCHAFKDYDGNPTNVLEQMDVDEFLNLFLDRLETAIKGNPQDRTIQSHFGGRQTDEMICKGCPHSSEKQQPFLALSLQVKNKKTIQEALETFIQSDMLEGDNAYLCEKCDKKVDTEKRTVIKKLPKYLIIALKRFEFDFDRMIRVKVNDYFEFPMELNMEPYTQEGLARKEKLQKKKENKGGDEGMEEHSDLNANSTSQNASHQTESLKYPKDYYLYNLTGTVVHTGTADSGHYYSFIKDKDDPSGNKWYEFNDKIVSDFDPNDIPNETFGGEDTFQGYNMVQMKSMKWRNAYLLFYERKTLEEVDADEEDEEQKKQSQQQQMQQQDIVMQNQQIQQQQLSEIEQKIAYENQKYWQNRFLFGQEYHDLVYDISLNWNQALIIPKVFLTKNDDFHIIGEPRPIEYVQDITISDPIDIPQPLINKFTQQEIDGYEHEVFKLAAGHYISILQRAFSKINIPINLNLLKAYINKNINNAKWLLEEFCNETIIEENLLQNSQREMRKFMTGLLYSAMLKVYPEEKDRLNLYWQYPQQQQQNITVIGNFILILIKNLYDVKRFVQNNQQYFQLLARFSSLGPEAREFLLKARIVGRLMDYYFEEVSPYKEEYKSMNDINVVYKDNPDIGLPTRIDKKQMSYFQEIIEKRRQKQMADAIPKYKYLIETISNCIRAIKVGPTRTPYQLDDYPETIHNNERDIFIPDAKFLKRIIQEAQKNRSINFICKTYCHYTWFDNTTYETLIRTVLIGLNDYDYDHVRPFLILAQYMLDKPSMYGNNDITDLLLTEMLSAIQQNKQYFKFMETIYDFIFKITSRNDRVRQWFFTKKDAWEWLIEWNQEHKLPPNPISQNSNIRLYKKRNMSMNMMMQQNYKNDMKAQFLYMYRAKRLQQLKDNVAVDLSLEVDLDQVDMQDHKFVVGEPLDLYYKKNEKLNSITVVQVLDEMINYKFASSSDDNVFNWQAKDYDRLLPSGALQNQYKNKYLDMLYQQQENKKQAQGNYVYDNQMQHSDEEEDSDDSGDNR